MSSQQLLIVPHYLKIKPKLIRTYKILHNLASSLSPGLIAVFLSFTPLPHLQPSCWALNFPSRFLCASGPLLWFSMLPCIWEEQDWIVQGKTTLISLFLPRFSHFPWMNHSDCLWLISRVLRQLIWQFVSVFLLLYGKIIIGLFFLEILTLPFWKCFSGYSSLEFIKN